MENWLQRIAADSQAADWQATARQTINTLTPVAQPCLSGWSSSSPLLSQDTDLITPVVLVKDRSQYDAETDEATEAVARRTSDFASWAEALMLASDYRTSVTVRRTGEIPTCACSGRGAGRTVPVSSSFAQRNHRLPEGQHG